MAERGYAGTSISGICELSGLPTGSIYWHFKDKAGLLGAVIRENAERWLAALPGPDQLPADPGARIDVFFKASAAALGNSKKTDALVDEFAVFGLIVADGAFTAHHIDPENTDIGAIFETLRLSMIASIQSQLSRQGN